MTSARLGFMVLACAAALAGLAAVLIALAVGFGGPAPIAALDSINSPFKNIDYRTVPLVQRYAARDGSALAYRHYASGPAIAAAPKRRVVLLHGSSASSRSMHPLAQALVTAWNDLPVTQFALNAEAKTFLTASYSYALATNFGTHLDYAHDIRRAPNTLKLIAGVDDELMFADRYAAMFADAGNAVPVTLVPGVNHIGLTLNPAALAAVVAACKD